MSLETNLYEAVGVYLRGFAVIVGTVLITLFTAKGLIRSFGGNGDKKKPETP